MMQVEGLDVAELERWTEMVFKDLGMTGYRLRLVPVSPVIKVDGLAVVHAELVPETREVVLYAPAQANMEAAKRSILHECAHFLTGSPAHDERFWDTYRKLLQRYGVSMQVEPTGNGVSVWNAIYSAALLIVGIGLVCYAFRSLIRSLGRG
jgi:hypothetical protein